jgi:hypothetical protein
VRVKRRNNERGGINRREEITRGEGLTEEKK